MPRRQGGELEAIRKAWSWKRVTIVSVLVLEAVVLGVLMLSARSAPMFGVAARTDDAQLLVADQRDVVKSIKVDRVVSPAAGWLVVQADRDDGVPDAILGSLYVSAGASNDVTIPLDPQQQLPRRVFVTLLADGGQPHVLEYFVPNRQGMTNTRGRGSALGTGDATSEATTKDKPVIAGGMVVTAHINLTPLTSIVDAGRAAIASASVPATSSTVTLYKVRAPVASWAVVSTEGTGGVPGRVLGNKAVDPGYSSTVTVELPGPAGRTKMRASLHVDLGVVGAFEFIPLDRGSSPDQPYVAGGESVSVPVRILR